MESSDYFGIVASFNGSEQFELCVRFSNHSGLASKPAYISHTTLQAVREKTLATVTKSMLAMHWLMNLSFNFVSLKFALLPN